MEKTKISIINPSNGLKQFRDKFEDGLKFLLSNQLEVKHNQADETGSNNFKSKIEIINKLLKTGPSIIWCAVGGDSCEEIIDFLDYDKIKTDSIIIGASDNTHLVLAVYLKTKINTVFGPNVVNLSTLNQKSVDQCIKYALGRQAFEYPTKMNIINQGEAQGILLGGNLFCLNNIIEKYSTINLENMILFFEEIEDEVSDIKKEIRRLKSTSILNKVSGLVIGNLVSEQSNDNLMEIIKSEFAEYNFPIIKVDYFGHNVKEFYPLPIGVRAQIDTTKNLFTLI